MQIKATVRYYDGLVRMADIIMIMIIINTKNDTKCWQQWSKSRSLTHCWPRYKMAQPPWKTVWQIFFFFKAKSATALQFNNCPPGHLSQRNKNICSQMFVAECLLVAAPDWKEPRCLSMGGRLNSVPVHPGREILLCRIKGRTADAHGNQDGSRRTMLGENPARGATCCVLLLYSTHEMREAETWRQAKGCWGARAWGQWVWL